VSVARRLVGSFGASALGPGVTLLVQLANVPVMLRLWGPELYGEWLMLSAIPTYLLLSDLGFGNVAGSAMTMSVHAGDRAGARRIFQSTTALVSLSSLILAAVAVTFILLLPLQKIFSLRAMPLSEARATLLLLCLNCLVILQWSVLMSAYRATGRYARGMLIVNLIRIVEGAGIFVILFTHGRPEALAAYMLVVSLLGTIWLVIQHTRYAPWLRMGVREAHWGTLRGLVRPAFAFMAFPACAAISTQGMTLVIGFTLGPLAVALFNPMRTLSRIPLQLTDAIKNSAWPELSAAFGRNDQPLARRLHRGAFQASLLIAAALTVVLWFVGPFAFRLWVHGRMVIALLPFHLLLVEVFVNSLWNTSSSVAMSVNRHERVSLWYLVFSVLSIVIVAVLSRYIGLAGVGVGMLVADLAMFVTVLTISTSIVGDTVPSLLMACCRPAELLALLSSIRHRPAPSPEAVESSVANP